MPLSTYAELRASVAGWLHRDSLTDVIPDFIRMAELEINRRLRIVPQEVVADLECIPGSRSVPLPADFGSPVGLWDTHVEPRQPLVMVPAANLPIDDSLSTVPRYWGVDGATIAFNCKADQAYSLQLRYLQNLFLSDDAPTNTLFARAPDLYLYGALAQSAPYLQHDARLPMWQATFERLLRSVAAEGVRAIGDAPLQTEIPATLMCGANSRNRHWGY